MAADEDAPPVPVVVDQLAATHDVTPDFVRALLRDEKTRKAGRVSVVEATPGDLLSEEWAAFITPGTADDPEFRTRHVGPGEFSSETPEVTLLGHVDRVVVADRIREVRALEGFHRVTPAGRQTMVRVDLDQGLEWLPAIEVHGEGIFLGLDESRLSAWRSTTPSSNAPRKWIDVSTSHSWHRGSGDEPDRV